MTIIEEPDKTVRFPKSSVYNIEKKIPELVGLNRDHLPVRSG